jgi:acetyltransferase-like isoleucine patch superfamily enzyme
LRIGNNSSIGYFNHLAAVNELIIGEHVVTANNVYIADNTHDYHNVNVPIMLQNVNALKPVRIGDGTWIGEHVCIIGASVGKQCVIGANAVVTNDIPDYSVAAGVPARIIKRYDFEQQRWVKVE